MAGTDDPVADLWERTIDLLADAPDTTHQQIAFVRLAQPLGLLDGTLLVAVGNAFTKDYLETRVRAELTSALSSALGADARFAVTVDPALDDPAAAGTSRAPAIDPQLAPAVPAPPEQSPERPDGRSYGERSIGRSSEPAQPAAGRGAAEPARLHEKYLFDSFVIGASNRFAHAAAVAVAEAPAKAYNPLFIYGDSGLGKTHLLHAIGHYAISLFPGIRVRYVNSEEFTNDFINSIGEGRAGAFQRRYREVDVLLVDDIQFLQGKEQTMEEFFHTFNTLHNANKQVVITSDVAPKQLNGFEDRMRSRFEWGLITDIQPPDLETRIAILRKKAASSNLHAPPDVLSYIASKISTNIRELEGALIRVTAFASLNRQQVDLALAEIVLKDLITDQDTAEITAAAIIAQTANYYSLSIDDLCGQSRSRVLVTARQIAMYLCRELTDMSLPKIGQQFGGRDHTTVMHANRKIRELMAERRSIYNQVTELTSRIKQQARG
ncbi:chromosomal replication initiator protein DnaA [Isoptericola sp. b441]|uniref:Chromosomal replication initiator protein DnaA n=1 Tax=Actinotalea lenta TaxID=3064654 RepID=A0ABT9D7T9_9CELL|nr:chromosomal replication initiator protein DnaA [Isoptericola sp. b441]MDO8106178.1 chromosomal replication initiator protein DnaA [Isoptericola sp. b441]